MSQWTRRKFIKNSAQGLALASVPMFFNGNPFAAFTLPPKGSSKLSDYFEHFGVTGAIIREVMAAGLGHGGDYCDVYFEHSITNYVGLQDKAVNKAYSDIDFGVGIRVLKGDQVGYSFTEEITPKAMKLAAQTAANIANGGKTVPPQELKLHDTPNYYPIKTSWEDVRIDKKIPFLQEINDKVFTKDNRIVKASIWFVDVSSYIMVATSEGRVTCDYRPSTTTMVSCTAEENSQRESNSFVLSSRNGIEYYTQDKVDKLANESVRRTVDMFKAIKPVGGEMEVVLAPGESGMLLHEAIGHGMEADFNRKGISIFADKIGQPVAEIFVSIVDDGTVPHNRGSLNVDDEGNDTQKTFLVENGILKSYMHDRISSKFYKVNPTGSGRRQSFRHEPIPRMRNTYMLPGPHKKEEIIRSVKKGIYAENFTNGQVFIGAGDFTFYVKSGYLIENGKMTTPIKDVNIIGNGPDVLSKIVMVADDLKYSEGGGTCGKNGQGVPASFGQPTVKVSSITVGGVNS